MHYAHEQKDLIFNLIYDIIKKEKQGGIAVSKILESGEMYLENILVLREKLEFVRAIDIVNYTGYSKPSISRALGLLREDGMVEVDALGHITLTPEGEARAQNVYLRHKSLTAFFCSIGIDEQTASADACKIEHVISEESMIKIREYLEKTENKEK